MRADLRPVMKELGALLQADAPTVSGPTLGESIAAAECSNREVGNLPFPRKLLGRGIKDMVRISDARMSGTAYRTVVLHGAPETDPVGPLAAVRNGDEILLDGPNRRLELLVADEELKTRLAEWHCSRPQPKYTRGYYRL